jgi:2-methylcitrate dehydratase
MSVAHDLAETALAVRYEDIPEDVRVQAKRLVIDAFACLIGGFESPTGRICRELAHELGGPVQATILGENVRVGLRGAILANQAMIRYLDYNDDMSIPIGPGDLAAAHPSGSLPTAIAVSELVGASGRQFLEALIAGYQIIGRMLDAFTTSLEVRGFHHGSVHAYAGAGIAGRLLGLTADQVANAMGIAGSLTIGLDILDADGEEYVMTKNIADGVMSEKGLLGALLAAKGLTGPARVIEGNKGFAHAVLGGADMYRSRPADGRWFIMDTVVKSVPAEATTHGHLKGTAGLVREHGLAPEDIEAITIRTSKRSVVHTGDPAKKYPRNKETADHSTYFLTAMAVLHGAITPRVYDEANLIDPRVPALIDKVSLVHGPEFDDNLPAAEVTIRTRSGQVLQRRVEREELKGEPQNPMTDADLRDKFLACAEGLLSPARVDRIIDACLTLDQRDHLADVLPLLTVERATPAAPDAG